jgi:hypothetical protein
MTEPASQPVITQEQVMAQLRILIPAICTALTAFGVSNTEAGSYQQIALAMIAPLSYIVVAIWSFMVNTRQAIIAKAATPGTVVILPKEETKIADALPANVTAAK